jgi:hypothetical protein
MKSTVGSAVWSSVLILLVSMALLPAVLMAQPVADINTTVTGSAADFVFRATFVNLGGTISSRRMTGGMAPSCGVSSLA